MNARVRDGTRERNGGLDFLPDLCGRREVLGLVSLAALTAIVVTLLRAPFAPAFWVDLGANAFYVLWIALLSAAVLCWARRRFPGRSQRMALFVLYLALLSCAAAVAFGARLLLPAGVGPDTAAVARTVFVAAVVDALALRYLVVLEAGKRAARREALVRFRALEARIRPHFLFNVLNTLAALVRHEPERAERAVLDLAELFRASLERPQGRATLGDEIRLARRYLALEELRLGERLRVRWSLADLPEDALVPALLLQPLVENAVYHGLEASPEGGCIEITGAREAEGLEVVVTNTIGGGEDRARGRGLALATLAERLALFFPDAPPLETRREEGRYTVVLRFPYRPAGGEEGAFAADPASEV
jgi:two-component system sensor histidine kinase AlgZ